MAIRIIKKKLCAIVGQQGLRLPHKSTLFGPRITLELRIKNAHMKSVFRMGRTTSDRSLVLKNVSHIMVLGINPQHDQANRKQWQWFGFGLYQAELQKNKICLQF